MSDIVTDFKDILTNYKIIDNQVVLEDSSIVSRIENEYKFDLEEFIKEITGLDDYVVSFEASKNGNLLRIPAATFFNKNFTDSHNDGLFLGFSFYPAKGLVYFKLDQGISSTDGDFNLFFVRAEKLRCDYINEIPSEFNFNQEKCGAGNVLGKNYSLDELSIELLSEDLKYLIGVYESINNYYEKVKKLSFNEIVEKLDI